MLAIFLHQDWIWIFIFEKKWIRTGSGYLLDFYTEIFLRMLQDVTYDGAVVFLAMISIFTKNKNDFVSMCCTINDDNSCYFIVNIFWWDGNSKLLLYCWNAALFCCAE